MAVGPDPTRWRVGLVGYGEVGRILAEDLRDRGVSVTAYDLELGDGHRAEGHGGAGHRAEGQGAEGHRGAGHRAESLRDAAMREHAAAYGVELAGSHAELAAAADLVISAVTANQAVPVAVACAPGIRAGSFVLDLNSCSPAAKQQAAAAVGAAGGRYVEGAVMSAVPPYRSAVPMLLGGPDAADLHGPLRQLGFAASAYDERLGIASATKMCRSVMIKGLEALVVESFTAARAYGVEERVLESLSETFPGVDWEKQGAYFFQRVVEHGRRRSEEAEQVAETVREVGLTPWSAQATAARQGWVADLADDGVFGARGTPEFARSPDWRTEADRILARVRPRQE